MNGEIYVSAKSGSDSSDGSIEKPFQTIGHALDFAKRQNGKRIILREGTYELSDELEFKDLSDMTLEGFQNENVRIVGAKKIEFDDFTEVTDLNIKRILPEGALEYDLAKHGLFDYGELKVRGFRRPYTVTPMELIADGKAMKLSCYPKKESLPVGEVLDEGSVSLDVSEPDFSNRGGKIRYEDDRISSWKHTDDLFASGFFARGYADDTLKVEKIDGEEKTVKFGSAVMFGLLSDRFTSYKFVNVLDEMTEEKEYYIDRKNGKLYFIAPKNLNKNSELFVTLTEKPLISLINTSNVTIKNLTLSYSRGIGIYMERGNGNLIENVTVSSMGTVGIVIGKGITPDKEYKHHFYKGEPVSKDLGSWNEHIYNDVMYDRDAGKNHTVKDCTVYGCGAGGISLGGGSRKRLEPAGNKVIGCKVYDCNRFDKTCKALINIDGVGNVISDCELYNATNMAIYLHGNEHIIEYNDIHDTCTETEDAGALYLGRDPSEQGNIVRYNYFHDVHCPKRPTVPLKDGMGTFAVYNDDGACGTTIFGNIFFRVGTWAIHNNCSKDIKIENNIFVECQAAVVHGDRFWGNFDKDPFMCEGGIIYDRLINQVKINKPPYSEKYPHLADYFKEDGKPLRNTFCSNIIYRCLNGLVMRHKDEWYINDYYLIKDGCDYSDVIKNYRAWYRQSGNCYMDEIESLEGKEIDFMEFQTDDILIYAVGFEKIDVERLMKGRQDNCAQLVGEKI